MLTYEIVISTILEMDPEECHFSATSPEIILRTCGAKDRPRCVDFYKINGIWIARAIDPGAGYRSTGEVKDTKGVLKWIKWELGLV